MKKLCVLSTLLLLLAASSVMAQDVRYNFEKGANFTAFKTYKWVLIKDAQQVSSLVDGQIKAAVDRELAAKGLTKTDADDADLYIGYQAAVGQEKEFTSFSSDMGYGPGWGRGGWYGGGYGGGFSSGSTSTIYIGQIALDMYDPASKNIVWRGTASKTLDTKAKPEKQQKNLAKAMAKLLKNFPPPIKD